MALLSEAGCSDPGNSYAGDLSSELEEGLGDLTGDDHAINSNVMSSLLFTR
jgi:hypothetical protein